VGPDGESRSVWTWGTIVLCAAGVTGLMAAWCCKRKCTGRARGRASIEPIKRRKGRRTQDKTTYQLDSVTTQSTTSLPLSEEFILEEPIPSFTPQRKSSAATQRAQAANTANAPVDVGAGRVADVLWTPTKTGSQRVAEMQLSPTGVDASVNEMQAI